MKFKRAQTFLQFRDPSVGFLEKVVGGLGWQLTLKFSSDLIRIFEHGFWEFLGNLHNGWFCCLRCSLGLFTADALLPLGFFLFFELLQLLFGILTSSNQ